MFVNDWSDWDVVMHAHVRDTMTGLKYHDDSEHVMHKICQVLSTQEHRISTVPTEP